MKIKASELQGDALNWAVQEAQLESLLQPELGVLIHNVGYGKPIKNYSTDWAQGGPIIEREKIAVDYDYDVWNAAKYGLPWFIGGTTPLIAAMRCYVASKLGDEVEVPDELCEV